MEINLLAELSDEQQEIIAGGQSGDYFGIKPISGLSRLELFDPSIFGDPWKSSNQSDDDNCHRTEETEGNAEIVRIVCERTERYP